MRNLEKKKLTSEEKSTSVSCRNNYQGLLAFQRSKMSPFTRFVSILEADIRFRYQGFTQETSQLWKKYKNYSHLTSIPGGAGVTSGKKQLTSGSGVGIY